MLNNQMLSALFDGETINSLTQKLGLSIDEINGALSNTDLVACPKCETLSNIGSLVGEHTNDCPKCGTQILKG